MCCTVMFISVCWLVKMGIGVCTCLFFVFIYGVCFNQSLSWSFPCILLVCFIGCCLNEVRRWLYCWVAGSVCGYVVAELSNVSDTDFKCFGAVGRVCALQCSTSSLHNRLFRFYLVAVHSWSVLVVSRLNILFNVCASALASKQVTVV